MAKKYRIKIPASELKILFAKSGNLCAYPDCHNPVIAEEEGDQKALAEVAHIIAYENNGPRSDPNLPLDERNKANNLILFCPTHHKLVDKFEQKHTVEVLREWKRKHEKSIKEKVTQLDTADIKAFTIPLLPQPFYVHAYPLQTNFTGRVFEREMLSNWLTSDKNQILTLVAMGGMGKSSLTWYWLKNDLRVETLNGIMWWSFYEGESSFPNFLNEAIIYFSRKKIKPSSFPSNYEKVRVLGILLQQHNSLIILDGFERQLRAYANLDAAYISDDLVDESKDGRACIDPAAEQFLLFFLSNTTRTKILITTRLRVHELEDKVGDPLDGYHIEELEGFQDDDAVIFMHAQNIKGKRNEIIDACNEYDNHPLSLRLLSGFIKKDKHKPCDILAAPKYYSTVHTDLKARRNHILEVSYNALTKMERGLLSKIAAFRIPITYDALVTFSDSCNESQFNASIDELIERGLLLRDIENNRYDLHPIVRHYAYERLSDKEGIHASLREYFSTVPIPELSKIKYLEDIAPIIELYYHTVGSNCYAEAIELFVDRLNIPLNQIGAHQKIIELLSPLLVKGEEHEREMARKRILHPLAKAYSNSGYSDKAVKHYESEVMIRKTSGEFRQAAITLRNLADIKITLGKLLSAENDLIQGVNLCRTAGEVGLEKGLHRKLGILFTYEGRYSEAKSQMSYIPSKFRRARQSDIAPSAELSLHSFLLNKYNDALSDAKYMNKMAYKFKREPDIIYSEWLLGVIYVRLGDLPSSEHHLNEAIVRCRRVNLVNLEPDILLAWACWHRLNNDNEKAEEQAIDVLSIAERYKYRLKQADIYNFLASLSLGNRKFEIARQQAKKAYERAWCGDPPQYYKLALKEAEHILSQIDSVSNL